MKQKLLIVGLVISVAWALGVSALYWRLKNNPRVIAVTADVNKDLLPPGQSGELEKITFLRHYLERYFNYDSNNFWPSQTSLSFLMSPELAEARVQEVSRLREKIQQKNLSQRGQLRGLRLSADGSFEARVHLVTREGAGEAPPESLFVIVKLRLQEAERTLENPWGLLVEKMDFASSAQEFSRPTELQMQAQSSLIVTLPCAAQGVDGAPESLKVKITTFNISEAQLTLAEALTTAVPLVFYCRDREFKLTLHASDSEKDLFWALLPEQGTPRRDLAKPRKKDVYDRTIEKVLGIELEN